MKKMKWFIRIILFICIIYFVICCDNKNSSNNKTSTIYNPKCEILDNIKVDSIVVEEYKISNICLIVEKSKYPHIVGMNDSVFENELNNIFVKNFNAFISSSSKDAYCASDADIKENEIYGYPSTINAKFDVLSKNDSIVSIVFTYFFAQGHGGNYGGN